MECRQRLQRQHEMRCDAMCDVTKLGDKGETSQRCTNAADIQVIQNPSPDRGWRRLTWRSRAVIEAIEGVSDDTGQTSWPPYVGTDTTARE